MVIVVSGTNRRTSEIPCVNCGQKKSQQPAVVCLHCDNPYPRPGVYRCRTGRPRSASKFPPRATLSSEFS
jgi:hypothetical protein